MQLIAKNLYKRYISSYIIKDFSHTFHSNQIYAIRGPNGSGKSTLVKLLSGFLQPSKGEISYLDSSGQKIDINDIYKLVSISSPYLEMDMQLNPKELFNHIRLFKGFPTQEVEPVLDIANLNGQALKKLGHFSNGMFQRFSLTLALLVNSKFVFLDEPTSYLDEESKIWFTNLLEKYRKDRLIIIASNEEYDFKLATEEISLTMKN